MCYQVTHTLSLARAKIHHCTPRENTVALALSTHVGGGESTASSPRTSPWEPLCGSIVTYILPRQNDYVPWRTQESFRLLMLSCQEQQKTPSKKDDQRSAPSQVLPNQKRKPCVPAFGQLIERYQAFCGRLGVDCADPSWVTECFSVRDSTRSPQGREGQRLVLLCSIFSPS